MNVIADQQMEDGAEADADCHIQRANKQFQRLNATIQ
jgi:hypothetical protein